VKKNTGRDRKAPSLYRLAFEEVVSGLLSAKKAKKESGGRGSQGRLWVV